MLTVAYFKATLRQLKYFVQRVKFQEESARNRIGDEYSPGFTFCISRFLGVIMMNKVDKTHAIFLVIFSHVNLKIKPMSILISFL